MCGSVCVAPRSASATAVLVLFGLTAEVVGCNVGRGGAGRAGAGPGSDADSGRRVTIVAAHEQQGSPGATRRLTRDDRVGGRDDRVLGAVVRRPWERREQQPVRVLRVRERLPCG